MTAIEILKTEHDAISVALAVLEHICQLLADKQPVEPSHLHDLAHFFQLYADRVHHAKEETLFERLDGQDSQLDRMMGSLCTQHVMAREFVHGMHEAAEKYAHGQSRAAKRFCEEAEAYRTLLTIHICDENHVLFPRIAKQLRGAEASKVTREFRSLDVQLLADPKTAASMKAVLKLQKIYRIEQAGCLEACRH